MAYASDLVDLNLIVSLVIAEVSIGVFLHYLLRQDRNPALDAIARMEAVERFTRIEAQTRHGWRDYYYPELLYYIINTKTKKAYYVSNDVRALIRARLIKRVRYTRANDFFAYFQDKGDNLRKEIPNYEGAWCFSLCRG